VAQFPYPKSDESVLAMLLATRLRELEKGFSGLRSFAKAAGISLATLHFLRTGTTNPTFRTVERIAERLNMPVWSLLGLSPDPSVQTLEREGLKLSEIRQYLDRQKQGSSERGQDMMRGKAL
jgi:transcriptional regulator with XRE-family HTH domain